LKLIYEFDNSIINYRVGVNFDAEFDKIYVYNTISKKVACITSPKFIQGIGDIKALFPRNQQWVAVG
jgi:hypothetical protein